MLFDEVIGQETAKALFRQMVQSDRLPHALLLMSSPGSGGLSMRKMAATTCSPRSNAEPLLRPRADGDVEPRCAPRPAGSEPADDGPGWLIFASAVSRLMRELSCGSGATLLLMATGPSRGPPGVPPGTHAHARTMHARGTGVHPIGSGSGAPDGGD